MTRPTSRPTRRTFLSAAAAGAVLPWRRPIAPWIPQARPWIPDDRFLAGLPELLELATVPGVSMAVVDRGAVAWRHAAGVANAETGQRVADDTVFAAASLGKPVCAYVVMKLAERGAIDLDRPLASVVRPADLPDDPRLDRITPRHVLSHTTGLPNWRGREAASMAPAFEPGARFQYSGEGFFWLQRVVEAVTGQGIDRAMRERLFEPAGMPRATYGWSADHRAWAAYGHGGKGDLARQFHRETADPLLQVAEKWRKPFADWTADDVFRGMEEHGSPLPRQPNFAVPNVAGSLLCTAGEYATFLALMMADRSAAPWELAPGGRAAMLTPAVRLNRVLSWGLGWGLETRDGARLFWHWGDNGYFKAFTAGDPAAGRAIVVFTNGQSGAKVYQRILASALGTDLAALLWV